MITMTESLENIALLRDLPAAELASLARRCRWRRFGAGEMVLAHLDPSTDILFLVEGRLRVSLFSTGGKEVAFEDLKEGQYFGEMAAIDKRRRSASVIALKPSNVAFLNAAIFRELMEGNFDVALRTMAELCRLVRKLDERVFEFSTLTVSNRIQAELLRLAGGGEGDEAAAAIAPPPRHAEIASRVSTHREAVTRELNVLARSGIVRQDRDALRVLDLPRLATMVHDVLGIDPEELD